MNLLEHEVGIPLLLSHLGTPINDFRFPWNLLEVRDLSDLTLSVAKSDQFAIFHYDDLIGQRQESRDVRSAICSVVGQSDNKGALFSSADDLVRFFEGNDRYGVRALQPLSRCTHGLG